MSLINRLQSSCGYAPSGKQRAFLRVARYLVPILCLGLSGCSSLAHKVPSVQGRLIDEETRGKIHLGMSQAEVQQLLGKPNVRSLLGDNNHWYYIHSSKTPSEDGWFEKTTIVFDQTGVVTDIKHTRGHLDAHQ